VVYEVHEQWQLGLVLLRQAIEGEREAQGDDIRDVGRIPPQPEHELHLRVPFAWLRELRQILSGAETNELARVSLPLHQK